MYTTHRTVGSVIPVAVRHVSPKITFGGGGAHTNSELPQAGFPESGEVLSTKYPPPRPPGFVPIYGIKANIQKQIF